jgi:hypothetical protein
VCDEFPTLPKQDLVVGLCEHGTKASSSNNKGQLFREQLGDYQILMDDSVHKSSLLQCIYTERQAVEIFEEIFVLIYKISLIAIWFAYADSCRILSGKQMECVVTNFTRIHVELNI